MEKEESQQVAGEIAASGDFEGGLGDSEGDSEGNGLGSDLLREIPKEMDWEATAHKVHLTEGPTSPPCCMQKQGGRARPLVRVFAAGKGASQALAIGLPICNECVLVAYKNRSET